MLAEIIPKIAAMTQGPEHPFYPRPSSAGPERCIRQMVYHGLKIPKKPLPGRAVIIFSDSSFHEDLTNDWIRKMAFKLHSEQMKIECRPPMSGGSIDGIVTDILGVDRLYEHKAINHFTFQRYWDGNELPLDNFAQVAIYVDAIQRHLNPDLTEAILLIKNKNTAQYMEFLCRYDDPVDILQIIEKTHSNGEREKLDITIDRPVKNACDKFKSVLNYIESKTLPKRQYEMDSWRCDYCAWGQHCWEGYEKEFVELKTEVIMPKDVVTLIEKRQKIGKEKSALDKQHKALTKEIKDIMEVSDTREGYAGPYKCEREIADTNRIDKALLTKKERDKATIKGKKDKLKISLLKTGGKK